MTNTMADLRREVARRLRETLHGREIDTLERGTPEMEHMLGIVTLGAISTPEAEKGTLLDPEHEFWQSYYRDITASNGVRKEIETAMHSLKEDGIFRVSSPYGDEAGILYVEVDTLDAKSGELVTTCRECGGGISTEPELTYTEGRYDLNFSLDCPECDFDETLQLHTLPK